jgi:glutathione S-transferase
MNELYFYPGACSLAVHIALIEVGLPHTLRAVDVMSQEHLGEVYRAVHPLARIPALRLAGGEVLTEVGALLRYVDEQSERPTLPRSGLAGARCLEWMSLLASGVHIPFAMRINPARFVDEESCFEELRRDGRERGFEMLRYVDARLNPSGTVLQNGPTLLDGYALVFFLWGLRAKLPVGELPRYKRLAQNQMHRAAVRTALQREGLSSVPELVLAL